MLRRDFLQLISATGLFALTAHQACADEPLLRLDFFGDGSTSHTFSDADLMALPQIEFTTTTIWTDGAIKFSGPSLASVLASVGAFGGPVSMVAVNNYKVEMPRDRIQPDAPIIANRMNGSPFSIRNKGPLWVVFPFDSDHRYQSEQVYSFSIWQLTKLQVESD